VFLQEGFVVASPAAARALTHRRRPSAHLFSFRRAIHLSWLLMLMLALASGILLGCATYHGALTPLGDVDQYPVGQWSPNPGASQVRVDNGIYLMPQHHLILVHILVPDTSLTSLGPGAVRGAVGVWWVALDDRAPKGAASVGKLVWLPSCVRFKTYGTGAAFDIVGRYLDGPSPASLSRYPLSFNPEDGSISVALSPSDEIAVPRINGSASPPASLANPQGTCPLNY
jgi:hypothetical protein